MKTFNMKKIISYLIIFTFLSISQASAVTPTPTPSPKPTSESASKKLSEQINDLKEKIASRVAQLKLVEKRGILGTIKEFGNTQITITDQNSTERIIDVDEITKFSSSSDKESFGISDLKSGMKISVIGLYNKDSQRLLARFINSYTVPLFLSGMIENVDKDSYTVTLAMEDGRSYLVDIENLTKTTIYATADAEKAGFSRIEKGQRSIVIGYADKKEANRMVATRILLFPNLPKNPRVISAPNAVKSNSSVTSSGSGKKLTPISP